MEGFPNFSDAEGMKSPEGLRSMYRYFDHRRESDDREIFQCEAGSAEEADELFNAALAAEGVRADDPFIGLVTEAEVNEDWIKNNKLS